MYLESINNLLIHISLTQTEHEAEKPTQAASGEIVSKETLIVGFEQILEILKLPTLEKMRESVTSAFEREQKAEYLYAELLGIAEYLSSDFLPNVHDTDEDGMYTLQMESVTYKYDKACWDQLKSYKTEKFYYIRIIVKFLGRFSIILNLLDPQQSAHNIYLKMIS